MLRNVPPGDQVTLNTARHGGQNIEYRDETFTHHFPPQKILYPRCEIERELILLVPLRQTMYDVLTTLISSINQSLPDVGLFLLKHEIPNSRFQCLEPQIS